MNTKKFKNYLYSVDRTLFLIIFYLSFLNAYKKKYIFIFIYLLIYVFISGYVLNINFFLINFAKEVIVHSTHIIK